MKIELLSCAAAEFARAVDYPNEQGPGLGYEFAADVIAALLRVAEFPAAWPLTRPDRGERKGRQEHQGVRHELAQVRAGGRPGRVEGGPTRCSASSGRRGPGMTGRDGLGPPCRPAQEDERG
jgi:hypothetical protein